MYWTLELASYLEDAPWPATKDELIDFAMRTGAPLEVVENLQQIQSICKQNNIHLILVFPPNYKAYNSAFEARIKSIAGDSISYFVYNPSELRYTDAAYYYDMGHLKLNGARIFTNELIDYLRLSASKK